jgi:hypothetical protein
MKSESSLWDTNLLPLGAANVRMGFANAKNVYRKARGMGIMLKTYFFPLL